MKKYNNGTVAEVADNLLCMCADGLIRQGVLAKFLPDGDGADARVNTDHGGENVIIGNCIRADQSGVS